MQLVLFFFLSRNKNKKYYLFSLFILYLIVNADTYTYQAEWSLSESKFHADYESDVKLYLSLKFHVLFLKIGFGAFFYKIFLSSRIKIPLKNV